jgi:hypothetical protein
MICLCCGSQDIAELQELGTSPKHVCKTCGARVPRHGDPVQRCPKCKEVCYDVEDFGDVTCFVHSRHRDERGHLVARGCVIPTGGLPSYETGVDRLKAVRM